MIIFVLEYNGIVILRYSALKESKNFKNRVKNFEVIENFIWKLCVFRNGNKSNTINIREECKLVLFFPIWN